MKTETVIDKINKSEAVLFDLDGTLYLGDNVIEGAIETLDFLRQKGIRVVFLTNNSSKTDIEYKKKLKRLNLFSDGDIVYSSLDAAADYIKDKAACSTVYAVACNEAEKYLVERGVNIVCAENADTVLLTFDKTLTYEKIVNVNNLLIAGAKYIATHPDTVCPESPYPIPDLGAFIQAIKLTSGRLPDVITGKPYKIMSEYIMKKLDLSPDKITMVGDRTETDIAFGVNAGFNTVLVFTGITDEKTYNFSEIKADISVSGVKNIKELFR